MSAAPSGRILETHGMEMTRGKDRVKVVTFGDSNLQDGQ